MASFKFDFSDLTELHNNLNNAFVPVAKFTIYDAARVARDGLKRAAAALPVDSEKARREHRRHNINAIQRDGLVNGVVVKRIESKGGTVGTTVTFGGYNDYKTERWPDGQPNLMIAASAAKGAEFSAKTNFVQKAEKGYKAQVMDTMEKKAAEYMEKAAEGKPFK